METDLVIHSLNRTLKNVWAGNTFLVGSKAVSSQEKTELTVRVSVASSWDRTFQAPPDTFSDIRVACRVEIFKEMSSLTVILWRQ